MFGQKRQEQPLNSQAKLHSSVIAFDSGHTAYNLGFIDTAVRFIMTVITLCQKGAVLFYNNAMHHQVPVLGIDNRGDLSSS